MKRYTCTPNLNNILQMFNVCALSLTQSTGNPVSFPILVSIRTFNSIFMMMSATAYLQCLQSYWRKEHINFVLHIIIQNEITWRKILLSRVSWQQTNITQSVIVAIFYSNATGLSACTGPMKWLFNLLSVYNLSYIIHLSRSYTCQ